MRHVDHRTYTETIPENKEEHSLLERAYPHLVPFRSVCIAKRVEPFRPSFERPYRYGTR